MTGQPKKHSALQERVNLFLTIIVIFLLIVVPPVLCGLFYLSQVPDVTFGGTDSPNYTRIWMYRERRPVGVGYQSRRIVETYTDSEICAETRLRFLLWGHSRLARPATSSQTITLVDGQWQPSGEDCR
jgi:hypothetical protein